MCSDNINANEAYLLQHGFERVGPDTWRKPGMMMVMSTELALAYQRECDRQALALQRIRDSRQVKPL